MIVARGNPRARRPTIGGYREKRYFDAFTLVPAYLPNFARAMAPRPLRQSSKGYNIVRQKFTLSIQYEHDRKFTRR